MLGIVSAAILIVISLRFMGRGMIGNRITQIISTFFNISWEEARMIYLANVRENIDMIIIVTIIVFFFILFRIYLFQFTRYFDEMVSGVDMLSQESKDNIKMSPELLFMEEKLNQVKKTLRERMIASKEAEERKNDLVVYLAHDIKTPLTSVIGYLNLLDEVPDMPKEQQGNYIHITLEKAYRLEQLMNELFDITKYNLQSMVLEKEEIDLNYMLMQMADEIFPILEPDGKSAMVAIDEEIKIWGDPDKLARVFNNILKNAAAYSQRDSIIEISAENHADHIEVQFKNVGQTIPKEAIASIFEKFYRVDKSRSTATGGAGLGLAIAKEIVTLHGGSIDVISENRETIFCVKLPK